MRLGSAPGATRNSYEPAARTAEDHVDARPESAIDQLRRVATRSASVSVTNQRVRATAGADQPLGLGGRIGADELEPHAQRRCRCGAVLAGPSSATRTPSGPRRRITRALSQAGGGAVRLPDVSTNPSGPPPTCPESPARSAPRAAPQHAQPRHRPAPAREPAPTPATTTRPPAAAGNHPAQDELTTRSGRRQAPGFPSNIFLLARATAGQSCSQPAELPLTMVLNLPYAPQFTTVKLGLADFVAAATGGHRHGCAACTGGSASARRDGPGRPSRPARRPTRLDVDSSRSSKSTLSTPGPTVALTISPRAPRTRPVPPTIAARLISSPPKLRTPAAAMIPSAGRACR